MPSLPLRNSALAAFAAAALAGAAPNTARAITHDAMVFHNGVIAGMQLASDYVGQNAPDWTSDYTQKSSVEFKLVAMEGEYTLGTLGQIGLGAGYASGVAAGIQDYVDLMNSVGDPVWFTDAEDPVGTGTAPGILSARLDGPRRAVLGADRGRTLP